MYVYLPEEFCYKNKKNSPTVNILSFWQQKTKAMDPDPNSAKGLDPNPQHLLRKNDQP